MKMLKMFLMSIGLITILAACGGNDNVDEPPADAPVEEDDTMFDDNDDAAAPDETGVTNGEEGSYAFTSFDLDVEYQDNQEVDVDYESEQDGMEAKYRNDFEGIDLEGDEAMQELEAYFTQLDFDSAAADEEVIDQVMSVFNLDPSYTEFELEVDFADGTEKEYKAQGNQ
ncbi:YusW family protein [Alkalihalophilus pseudofirmus]|uniref:YusW family protein n=1 Tax=Alkalihalophilus pseudofirmus TaxID=79885 RepID=UPI00259B8E68|nr:YusW family protein [Alkalihalophilus pseudofirmus]WEG17585.1 YusW family protein [Alkalihalophilus pseudofirmus]